jgi:hypothetical protein
MNAQKDGIDCKRISALLKNSYPDGGLDEATRQQVRQHMAECPACRQAGETLAAISCALRNAPRVNPPESLWLRIRENIRPASVPCLNPSGNFSAARFRFFSPRKSAFAFAAAAAALVIAAVGFYFHSPCLDNGGPAPSLTSLAGNGELRAPDVDFGSDIEKYFL